MTDVDVDIDVGPLEVLDRLTPLPLHGSPTILLQCELTSKSRPFLLLIATYLY